MQRDPSVAFVLVCWRPATPVGMGRAALAPQRAGMTARSATVLAQAASAHDVGNQPAFIGDGGVLVSHRRGADWAWRASRELLADAVIYRRTSRAAYYRSRDYWPALVANQLLKVVS